MPGGRTSNVGVVARTAGGNWLTADVDDWQCLRQECSSPPNIEVLCSADTGERWFRVCTGLVVEHQASAARRAADDTIRDLMSSATMSASMFSVVQKWQVVSPHLQKIRQ